MKTNTAADDEGGILNIGKLSLSEKTQDRPDDESSASNQALERKSPGYDITLLAVIGIFEEMKEQRSVALWVKNGGLWGASGGCQRQVGSIVGSHSSGEDASSTGQVGDTEVGTFEDDPQKISASVGNGVRPATISQPSVKKRKPVDGEGQHGALRDTSGAAKGRQGAVPNMRGKDASGVGEIKDGNKTAAWHENEENLRYWAAKGREVCGRMGIDADEDGVKRVGGDNLVPNYKRL